MSDVTVRRGQLALLRLPGSKLSGSICRVLSVEGEIVTIDPLRGGFAPVVVLASRLEPVEPKP